MKKTTQPPNKVLLALLMLLPFFAADLRASSPLTAAATIYDVSCYNGYDGGLIISASGGTGPYLYSLQNIGNYNTGFQQSDTFRSLNAGAYIITVVDATGTSVVVNATLTQPPPLSIIDSVLNATGGLNNGAIFAFAAGGTPPYEYSWQGLTNTGSVITDLSPGYEAVTVADSLGCNTFLQVYVDTGSSVFSASAVINGWPNGCYPFQNFQILAAANGGSGPYSFSLDGGPYELSDDGLNSFYFFNVTGPVHTIKVKDARNVTLTLVDTFPGIADRPLNAYAMVTDASDGNDNGSATIVASGGSPGYTYDFGTSSTFTDLAPGTYSIYVMDTNDCEFSLYFSVNDSTSYAPLSATGTVSRPVCINVDNFNNGQILVSAAGGLFPYQMEMDNGGFSPANNGSSQSIFWVTGPGMHTISVQDAGNSMVDIEVYVPGDSFGIIASITNVSGNMNNGAIALSMTPGVAPYTYYWSDGTTSAFDTGLAVGTNVQVTATDASGCPAYGNFNIDSGAFAAAITSVIEPTACSGDGQFTLTATGGTQPYLDQYGNQLTPSITYNGLPSGTYTYLIIDALMDTITLTGTIAPAPAPLEMNYTSTAAGPSGDDGTAHAVVTGGTTPYTYQWSMSAPDTAYVNGLAPGSYGLTVSDSFGCSIQLNNIIVNDTTGQPLTGSAYAFDGSPCGASGSIAVYASGGTTPYIYSVGNLIDTTSSPDDQFAGLLPGIYPVAITDAMGNTFATSVTLSPANPDAPITITGSMTNATGGISNGSILVNVSGGAQPLTYIWQNNTTYTEIAYSGPDLTGQAAGNYQLNVTDSLGCSQQAYFTIDTGSSVFAVTALVNNSPCYAQASILVTATGGSQPYMFSMNGNPYQPSNQYYANTNEFQGLSAGIYMLKVKDAEDNLLTVQDTIAVQSDNIVVTGTVTNAANSGATNGAITLHATGGTGYYGYYWANDNTDSAMDSGLTAGVYAPYVYDSMGCEVNPVFVVGTGREDLSADIQVVNISCFGDTTGVITVWGNSANQPLLYALDTGSYSPANVFTGLPAGSYTVYVKDATGMVLANQRLVRQPASPLTVSGTITNAGMGMDNGAIALTISGGTRPYISLWSDIPAPATFRTSLYGGSYDADVIDAAGCSVFEVFTVDTGVGARISSISNVNCYGDSTGTIHVSASGGTPAYSYKLGSGSYQADSIFTGLAAGTYTITVRAAGNDSTVIHQTIAQASPVIIQGTVSNDTGAKNDGAITLAVSGGTQPYTFNWGGGVTIEDRTGLGAGSYTVTLTDSAGCQASASFMIQATGINNISSQALSLDLYPNPASTSVELGFALPADQQVPVLILDALGQQVFSEQVAGTAGQNKIEINTAAWSPGLYVVRIGANSRLSAKLQVAH